MHIIINTSIKDGSRMLNGIDSAMGFEMYKKYSHMGICANHLFDKFTLVDEEQAYIGSFKSMDKLIEKRPSVVGSNMTVITHEDWLNAQNPNWRTEPRYQYY